MKKDQHEKIEILGVNIDMVDMDMAVGRVEDYIKEDGIHVVYTPNAEIVMSAYKDDELKIILNGGDMLIPDGIGVVFAAKLNGKPVEKVGGFDLTCKLLKEANENGYKIFFFGGKPGIPEKAMAKLKNDMPNLNFVGSRNGYFKEDETKNIIQEINLASPDLLFVALGAPRQEKWIHKYKNQLNAKVAIGVGGSFDILAGESKRAPKIFINLGLEWFYRLLKEPWRYKRMMALPVFAVKVIGKKIRNN